MITETKHFLIEHPESDSSVADVSRALESAYDELSKFFDFQFEEKQKIIIFKDLVNYSKFFKKNFAKWVVGGVSTVEGVKAISLVSPSKWSLEYNEHLYSDLWHVIPHEVFHLLSSLLNKNGKNHGVLEEGLACYFGRQINEKRKALAVKNFKPLRELCLDPSKGSKDTGVYYTETGLFAFWVVEKFGEKAVSVFIKHQGTFDSKFEKAFKMNFEEAAIEFEKWVKNYKVDYEKLYLEVLDDIEKNYSYLSYRGVKISDLRRKAFEFKTLKSDKEFAEKLGEMIAVFEDPHLYVDFEGKSLGFKRKTLENYSFNVISSYIVKPDFENEVVKIKMIGKTLYVFVRSWQKANEKEIIESRDYFEKSIKKNKFEKVVFDVRPNGGGKSSLAMEFVELLVPKGKIVKTMAMKKINDAKLTTSEVKGTYGFNGKVVVLIGNRCMSSNEMFILAMKEIGAVLIGDRTYGSSGNPLTFNYGLVKVLIPSWIMYKMNGEILEGNGVKPDIFIPSDKTVVDGKDLALEKALSI